MYTVQYPCINISMYTVQYPCINISIYTVQYPCINISMYTVQYPCIHIIMYTGQYPCINISMYTVQYPCINISVYTVQYPCLNIRMYSTSLDKDHWTMSLLNYSEERKEWKYSIEELYLQIGKLINTKHKFWRKYPYFQRNFMTNIPRIIKSRF